MRPVLYVTFDGILQPLGYSQVARVVCGLAERGIPYRLVSLERPQELAQDGLVRDVRARLAKANVTWNAIPYDVSGTVKAAASNVGRATAEVLRLTATRAVSLVHARAYHAGLVALAAHTPTRVPYLFDARSYWIDERITDGRWFGRPAVRTTARAIERRLFRDAAAVVTLTDIQRDDLVGGKFGPWTRARVVTIPTCADYDEFALREPTSHGALPKDLATTLAGKRVIGLVGSLNRSYFADETLDLVKRALAKAPDLHVLVLSAQADEWRALLARANVDPARTTVTVAPHAEMPAYTRAMDFVVMLLVENAAKRASVPTKLAELFAAGVRPVHFGCNPEVTAWVERAGSGHVLARLEASELDRAATFVATTKYDRAALASAREATKAHFSLESGLARYEGLLRTLA